MRVAIVGLALACAAGCGTRGRDYFVPAEAKAREALEAALSAWKDGQPYRTITTATPPVEVVDNKWRDGHKLAGYEVLKEESGDDGKRWFSVKLKMQKPAGEVVVRYVVVGKDPLWVCREEDYKKM